MVLTVQFKAHSRYDTPQAIETELLQAKVDVFSEGFSVKPLDGNLYEINLPKPPENYQEILSQWGEILDAKKQRKKRVYSEPEPTFMTTEWLNKFC